MWDFPLLESDQTHAIFWTFFGFEGDVINLDGDILKINSREVNLSELNK